MTLPPFLATIARKGKHNPTWGLSYFAALVMPWMFIYARAGVEVCSAIIGILFLWRSIRLNDWRWLRQPFAYVCLAIWVWLSVVVTPLALDSSESLMTAMFWMRMPLLFLALRYWLLESRESRYVLGLMLALMLAFVTVDSLWQFLTGVSLTGHPVLVSGRLTGPMDGAKVGLFIAKFVLPVAAILLLEAGTLTRRRMAMCGLLYLTCLLTILLSGERSAFMTTMLASGTVALLMMWKEKQLRLLFIAAGAALITMVVSIYFVSPWIQLRTAQAIDTMQDYRHSDYGQLAGAAYDIGMAHPTHGAGLRNFRHLCPELPYKGSTFTALHPHNFYAEWFSETGAVGLGLFLTMLITLLRLPLHLFGQAKGPETLRSTVVIALMVQLFFPLIGTQSFFDNWSGLLVWYALSLAFALLPNNAAGKALAP